MTSPQIRPLPGFRAGNVARDLTLEFEKNNSKVKGMTYVPSIGLYVSDHKTHLEMSQTDTESVLIGDTSRIPTMHEFKHILSYWRHSNEERHKKAYDEAVGKRDPWRALWFSDRFIEQNGDFYLINQNTRSRLDDFLFHDKREALRHGASGRKISFSQWLYENTSHGLPTSGIKEGSMTYWSPRNDRVAGLVADKGGTHLVCSWGDFGYYETHGVYSVISPEDLS